MFLFIIFTISEVNTIGLNTVGSVRLAFLRLRQNAKCLYIANKTYLQGSTGMCDSAISRFLPYHMAPSSEPLHSTFSKYQGPTNSLLMNFVDGKKKPIVIPHVRSFARVLTSPQFSSSVK